MKKVAVIMGSDSDWPVVKGACTQSSVSWASPMRPTFSVPTAPPPLRPTSHAPPGPTASAF